MKFRCINTLNLSFGVSSSPGIFQRAIEYLLQDIPHVVVRMDDMLVSGEDDVKHLEDLNEVYMLTRISQDGLRLRQEKYIFLLYASMTRNVMLL